MEQAEFVNGTSGKPEYRIIARVGRCVVGIKPEFQHDTKAAVFVLAVRLRFCADPSKDFSDQVMTATELAQTFPHIPFKNVDNVRASFPLACLFKRGPGLSMHEAALERATESDFVKSLMNAIAGLLKTETIDSPALLGSWVGERWEALVDEELGPKIDDSAVAQEVAGWLANIGKAPSADENA